MSGKKANLSSLDSLDKFQKNLLVFNEEILLSLSRVRREVAKRREMLEEKLPLRLTQEMKRCEQELSQAKQDIRNATTRTRKEEAALAKRRVDQKNRDRIDQMERVRRWKIKLPALVDKPGARLLKLKSFVVSDMSQAAELLKKHSETLDDYTRIQKG